MIVIDMEFIGFLLMFDLLTTATSARGVLPYGCGDLRVRLVVDADSWFSRTLK